VRESIEVIVTREDIEKGIPEDDNLCPIAIAVKREEAEVVEVGGMYISFFPSNHSRISRRKYYSLPDIAIEFIKDFDNAREVKPFVFTALLRHERGL